MKQLITIIIFLIIGACTIIEIIDKPIERSNEYDIYATMQKDTTQKDTTQKDTTKYPIIFDVNVEDWKDTIDVNLD